MQINTPQNKAMQRQQMLTFYVSPEVIPINIIILYPIIRNTDDETKDKPKQAKEDKDRK